MKISNFESIVLALFKSNFNANEIERQSEFDRAFTLNNNIIKWA